MGIRFTNILVSGAIGAILSFTVLPAGPLLASSESEITGIRANTGFSLPSKPILPEKEIHPSLWFSAQEIESLREKRYRDSLAEQLWKKLTESPYLTDTFPPVIGPQAGTKPIHKYYGDMARRAKHNALFSLIATDPEKRETYLKRAIEALLRTFDPNINGGPVDEIYRAIWVQNFSAAYDWVFNSLNESENSKIRHLLAREAKFLYDNLFSFAESQANHLSKPAWGLGTLALTLSGHPDASLWLGRAIEASNNNTHYPSLAISSTGKPGWNYRPNFCYGALYFASRRRVISRRDDHSGIQWSNGSSITIQVW